MASKFKKVVFATIDEGQAESDLNASIAEAVQKLIAYRDEHGTQMAHKQKAVVTLKVAIQFVAVNDKEGNFGIKCATSLSIPSRPPRLAMAYDDSDDDGKPALFARASGATAGDPRQGVLTTRAGAVVDQKTGEVLSNPPAGKVAAAGQ